ncbi:MAG: Rrf2 family transcriptional regulator [Elusimicrobia bacterium]|jgi:Rrf2 family cysteine metabolism transcriptional repressor|nr:Rrf2 family transcriptional regulator [Elusimicrobiota bacterium]
MKISTKGRYAVRCMLNLAIHQEIKSIPVARIAKQEDISPNYIEQLFLQLKNKGLVKSQRGRGGGYKLAKKPSQIPISEIIEEVEGPIVTVSCIIDGDCDRYDICTTKYLWQILSNKIKEILDETTLQDLCEMARDKMGGDIKHKLNFNI